MPQVDLEDYALTIKGAEGTGLKETELTYEDLLKDVKDGGKFERHSVTTVIQCNGNRREDYHYVKSGPFAGKQPAFGPPHWVCGAIGCATWEGVRLRDLLRHAGMDVDGIALRHKETPEKVREFTGTGIVFV